MTSNLDKNEETAWRTFLHVSTRLLALLDEELRERHGEPLSNFDVLSNLHEALDRRLRMSDLAGQTLFSKSRLSYTISVLEGRGLVRREPDPEDRRGVFAVLTPDGARLHRRLAATHVAGIRKHFLSATSESQHAALVEALTPVLAGIEPARHPED